MPVEVKCQGCGRLLRGPDKMAGKQVKCPNCSAILSLPTLSAEKPPEGSAKDQASGQKPTAEKPEPGADWFMQTENGEEYGPVTKEELDHWVEDGRIDSSCQLLRESWEQWKWAEEIYPDLADPDGSEAKTQELFAGITDSGPHVTKKDEAEEVNPFESPRQSAGTAAAADDEQVGLSEGARRALQETQPWVTFMAILGFVGGALGLLIALGLLVMSLATFQLSGICMAFVLCVGPALYLYAAYSLFNYGRSIGVFLKSGAGRHLEDALVSQKSFWKLVGIVTAIFLALSVLQILGALLILLLSTPAM